MKTVKIICTVLVIGAFGLATANAQENRLSYGSADYMSKPGNDKEDKEKKERHNKFGVKGGVNISNLYIDDVHDEQVKESFHFGVYSKMNVAGAFSIQPEMMYSRKGAEVEYRRNNLQGNVDYSLDYIDFPLLMRVDIGALNLHAGPYASYLVDAEVRSEDVRGGSSPTANLNEDAFHSFDYGVSGGLGLEWKVIDMGVRYNYGLRDVGSYNRNEPGNALESGRNSVAQFYIGLGF
jgi:hypothetical protein